MSRHRFDKDINELKKYFNNVIDWASLDTMPIKVRFGVLAKWTLTMFLLGARVVKAILRIAKCCAKLKIGQKEIGNVLKT